MSIQGKTMSIQGKVEESKAVAKEFFATLLEEAHVDGDTVVFETDPSRLFDELDKLSQSAILGILFKEAALYRIGTTGTTDPYLEELAQEDEAPKRRGRETAPRDEAPAAKPEAKRERDVRNRQAPRDEAPAAKPEAKRERDVRNRQAPRDVSHVRHPSEDDALPGEGDKELELSRDALIEKRRGRETAPREGERLPRRGASREGVNRHGDVFAQGSD